MVGGMWQVGGGFESLLGEERRRGGWNAKEWRREKKKKRELKKVYSMVGGVKVFKKSRGANAGWGERQASKGVVSKNHSRAGKHKLGKTEGTREAKD